MNKMLIAVFDTEAAAHAGLQALRQLHTDGDITLYATGWVAKDLAGTTSVPLTQEHGPVQAGVGLAVVGLVGLLGGPLGVPAGASTSATAGSLRDFWVAGVSTDFVAEAQRLMEPGRVALVAELDEEWISPLDEALAPLEAVVLRRARSDVLDTALDVDITAFKSEIKDLEAEAAHANEVVKVNLLVKLATSQASLRSAERRARERVETLRLEAGAKAATLRAQMDDARSDRHDRIDERLQRVQAGYHARGHKLAQAWNLTKEALSG